jgi:hypothetical protein
MQDRHGDVKLNLGSVHAPVGAVCVHALRKACNHTICIPSAPARASEVVVKGEKGPESRPVAPMVSRSQALCVDMSWNSGALPITYDAIVDQMCRPVAWPGVIGL